MLFFRVIHKQAKQTESCFCMFMCKCFESATCVIESYDLQDSNIHLH